MRSNDDLLASGPVVPGPAIPRPGDGLSLPREPKQERSRRKREELLDAAERLFSERRFQEVTVEDIASAAGYPTTTFYNYFSDKTQAFVLVADRYFSAIAPIMGPLTDVLERGVDPREAIRRSIDPLFDHRMGLPWLRRTWRQLTLTDPATRAYQTQLNDHWEGRFAELLEAGIAAGLVRPLDVHVTASVIRMLVDGVVDEIVIHGDLGREEVLDTLADLLAHAMLTEVNEAGSTVDRK